MFNIISTLWCVHKRHAYGHDFSEGRSAEKFFDCSADGASKRLHNLIVQSAVVKLPIGVTHLLEALFALCLVVRDNIEDIVPVAVEIVVLICERSCEIVFLESTL